MTADTPPVERAAKTGPLSDLLPALRRLDRLLEIAVASARAVFGAEAAADRYRGLYISDADVERLLARQPGAPTLWSEPAGVRADGEEVIADSRLAWLAAAFDLTPFEVDLVILALAPEIDLRYERLYAYLQDDVTRRRPSVDLALNLLCRSAEERVARRAHFGSDASLVRHQLMEVSADPSQPTAPLLAHALRLDEQIVSFLLGQDALDRRVAHCCRVVDASDERRSVVAGEGVPDALSALTASARAGGEPLRLYFHGPAGSGKRRAAEAAAASARMRLLVVDAPRLLEAAADAGRLLRTAVRAAWLGGAIPYLDGVDAIAREEHGARRASVADALAWYPGVVVLAGTQPWVPDEEGLAGMIAVPFGIPAYGERRAIWRASLRRAHVRTKSEQVDTLASRFALTPRQIDAVVAAAVGRAAWRAAAASNGARRVPGPNAEDLFACARAHSGHDLAALAARIEPAHGWDDIVLPADAIAQLRELCQRVALRERVLGDWGFGARLARGRGTNALFTGPPGTGKTMAAEIIARELGLDMYRVDLAGVVSKYIGETEKNLDRIFAAAEHSNAIVFFDEADALFGKRSEVRDSHDRYANIEISYLLQRMEAYEGITILATNLRGNLDEAFVRRLAFTVHFPFPDEASRRRIWAVVWPREVPLEEDVDFAVLARQFKLSGGSIRNIALASAFLAAEGDGPVRMQHLLDATRREFQKMGKQFAAEDLAAAGRAG